MADRMADWIADRSDPLKALATMAACSRCDGSWAPNAKTTKTKSARLQAVVVVLLIMDIIVMPQAPLEVMLIPIR